MAPKAKEKCSSTPNTRIKITKTSHNPLTPPTANKTTDKTTTTSNMAAKKPAPTPKRKTIRYYTCRLNPPCRKGHGGPAKTILPIGKYFFSEEALIHDLRALKQGAVYNGEKEFFKRVKAWYKAEVDRLMHRKQVESEVKKENEEKKLDGLMIRPLAITKSGTTTVSASKDDIESSEPSSPTSETSRDDSVSSDSEYSDFEDDHLRKITTLRATDPIRKRAEMLQTPSPTPARAQSSRAVKRKAETPTLPPTPAKTPSPKRRKFTLLINKRPNPEQETEQPGNLSEEKTKGNYVLSELDFKEYQLDYSDRGKMADGLDVANFMIGLEKAVEDAVSELVAARLGNGILSLSSPRASNQGIRARWRRFESISFLRGQGRIMQGSKDEEEEAEVFEPAGDAVAGEDWRPPRPSLSVMTPETKKKGTKKGLALRLTPREETPAPEAEMQMSPTLGRWQLADRRASIQLKVEIKSEEVVTVKERGPVSGGGGGEADMPIEEPNRRSVQVSGLKFHVELRTFEVGHDGEGKRDIWFHML